MENNPEKQRISAFIICLNEERNILRCLESVRWCDEIVIIDSGSTDQTIAICQKYTSKIISHPWEGFVKQKRFGLEQCTSEWVLNIDADEEVSPDLKNEILSALADPANRFDGFELSRVVFYLGKWWRRGGWYPEFRLRLMRRNKTTWGGEDPHEKALVDGPTRRMTGELRHFTYANIFEQVRALNNHSSAAAQSMLERNKAASLSEIIVRPIGRFLKFYFIKKGFLEGFPGFIVACLESYYVFLKYVKLWDLKKTARP